MQITIFFIREALWHYKMQALYSCLWYVLNRPYLNVLMSFLMRIGYHGSISVSRRVIRPYGVSSKLDGIYSVLVFASSMNYFFSYFFQVCRENFPFDSTSLDDHRQILHSYYQTSQTSQSTLEHPGMELLVTSHYHDSPQWLGDSGSSTCLRNLQTHWLNVRNYWLHSLLSHDYLIFENSNRLVTSKRSHYLIQRKKKNTLCGSRRKVFVTLLVLMEVLDSSLCYFQRLSLE